MADTSFTLTFPSAQATRILNGYVFQNGYQDTIEDGDGKSTPNPQTKKAFAKEKLVSYIKENVKAYEANADANTARKAAITDVEDNVSPTVT